MQRAAHVTGSKAPRDKPAPAARGKSDPSEQVLAMQRAIGNRATVQALQRWSIDPEDVWDVVKGPIFRLPGSPFTGGAFDLALRELFEAAVTYGRAKSTTHPIPASFDTDLDGYAAANPADGKILTAARARQPTFHNGGLVPSDALAMTLDTDVFCGSGEPTVDTYIHELVHVWQYGEVGPVRFIENLLGSAAFGTMARIARGQPVDIMKASSYEMQAYNIECRFKKWAGPSRFPLPDSYCDAQGQARP